MNIKNESILNAKEQYIVHQTNSISTNAGGLAAAIFEKYPYSNIYQERLKNKKSHPPGTIEIRGNGIDQRYIINLMGQRYPGESVYKNDTKANRLEFFKSGLKLIENIPNIKSIALPYNIGCGLAGGNWKEYSDIINSFIQKNQNITVAVYKI